MANELPLMSEDVEIIQKLGNFPNADDGLSAEEVKEKFDAGPKVIKNYINETLVPAVRDLQMNKVDGSELRAVVEGVLEQAKASGEFDGPRGIQGEKGEKGEKGDPGKDGADGYTPVKGKDYFTEAEKAEIFAEVKAEIGEVATEENLSHLFGFANGYLDKTGMCVDFAEGGCTDFISVVPGDTFTWSGASALNNTLGVAEYDENKNFIGGDTLSTQDWTVVRNVRYMVKSGRYVRFSSVFSEPAMLIKERFFDGITELKDKTSEYTGNIKTGMLSGSSGDVNAFSEAVATEYIPALPGDRFLVTCFSQYDACGVCFYDAQYRFMRSDLSGGDVGYKAENEEVVAPSGTAYVRFGSIYQTDILRIYKFEQVGIKQAIHNLGEYFIEVIRPELGRLAQHLPAERSVGIDPTLLFHLEALIEVVDGVAVCLKCHRAVLVPLEEQRPVVRVIAPEVAQTVHALIMAEPAAVPAGCFVGRCQASVVLAVQAAQALFDTELCQWRPFPLVQLTEPGRLVRGDADVFHDISFLAPRGALIGEGAFALGS